MTQKRKPSSKQKRARSPQTRSRASSVHTHDDDDHEREFRESFERGISLLTPRQAEGVVTLIYLVLQELEPRLVALEAEVGRLR